MNQIDNNAQRHETSPGAVSPGDQPDPQPTAANGSEASKPRRPRGFAAMDRKLVTELARKGGKAAHQLGAAHEFNSDEAREAGRKGGLASHVKRRARDVAAGSEAQNGPKSGQG